MEQAAELRRHPPVARFFPALNEGHVAFLGAALILGGLVSGNSTVQFGLLAAGCGTLGAALVFGARRFLDWRRKLTRLAMLDALMAAEEVAMAVTDSTGRVLRSNCEGVEKLGLVPSGHVSSSFSGLFATPLKTIRTLMEDAAIRGSARADRVSHRGHVRVSVVADPHDFYLWRAENLMPSRADIGASEIDLPMVVIRSDGDVLAANPAMTRLIGRTVPPTMDQLLGSGGFETGDVCRIDTCNGPVSFRLYSTEARGDVPCQEVYFLPPEIGGGPSARLLFDTLPVPMIKVAVDSRVVACNQGARDLLGRDLPVGTPLGEGLSGLGRPITDWLQDAHSGNAPSPSEFLQVRGDGCDRFVQVTLKPVEEQGEAILLAVLTDATELKTLEAQFVQSQKMQAIGQLAGGVAHDFNNLLTAISGHCDLLLLRHDEGDPAYGDLVQINQNANRAASLVGQLLAFSRKQTLSPETVDLPEVLSDLTHLLSRLVGETVKLSLRHEDVVPPIRVDKRQLEQVIMNLVVNARDAMPDGGEITVETASVWLETELRRDRAIIPPGNYSVVRVRDMGCGIKDENLQKIFEPFYTTKKTGEGTGLGLSTAYGIVKQTGGFIFADSAPGGGTTFTLYFPSKIAAVEEDKPQPEAEASEPVSHADGVVLLVEDETSVRAFASRALRMRGYTVIEAENAEEALEQLKDLALEVDVFVTDVVMPGMDGPSWVREALKERPGTRVVFVSGYAEDALSDHQAQIPNSIFLPKPFSLQELTTTVQRQFH
ncbi:ATP-binding response regulator [Meridianimarinicoccus aquatilis]|uniref:histidine kinase n=1 Tax=Meridianimarinicoccus aquatilis TaxID=2552766 RepID=A0A4R6APJ1_9RHOB|nr:PAS domain-containing hybrid sensor histidine kinase/response regulator [Fluviibacterium aquatile]TDL85304.1 PAS domain-containing hybrid sensor histidine kinase/response regulator [Fluviibacterium aquatile]